MRLKIPIYELAEEVEQLNFQKILFEKQPARAVL
jgi:hypothetical protein